MVARPPVSLRIRAMVPTDLPAVQAIEQASFTTPWPPHAYRSELESNRLATYLVARVGDKVVGYAGMWLMVDEAHITTFAIHPGWRRRRIGEQLLLALLVLGRAAPAADVGDPATLVPTYVALPRGIAAEAMAWSPDLRSA